MDMERFDPATDAGSVRACHEIYLAGAPIDVAGHPPESYDTFAGWMIYGWTEDPSECWLASDPAGRPRGWYRLTLPERENRHHAHVRLAVHPSSRRAGIGRELVRHAGLRALEAGRTVLMGDSQEGSPGEAFARTLGARPGTTEIHRVLRVDSVTPGHLARLRNRAEPAAAGYSLVTWEGLVPDERLAEVAGICAAIEDAPQEPGLEAQRWDADRVRQSNQRAAAQGLRSYTVGAQEDATGELVALTEVGVEPALPSWGFQGLTAVTRPHRGHRLGLLVKVAMMELLAEREPQLTHMLTGNADGNEHMIAINVELGYKPLDRWSSWQLDVSSVVEAQPA